MNRLQFTKNFIMLSQAYSRSKRKEMKQIKKKALINDLIGQDIPYLADFLNEIICEVIFEDTHFA